MLFLITSYNYYLSTPQWSMGTAIRSIYLYLSSCTIGQKKTLKLRSPSLTHMIILRHPDVGMMGPKVKCQDPNDLKTFCLHNNQKLWSTSNIIVKPSPPSSSNSTLASVRYELISSANGPLWLSSSWYVPCSEMTPFVMTMISSTCDRKLIPCVTRILVCTHISKYQQTLAVC